MLGLGHGRLDTCHRLDRFSVYRVYHRDVVTVWCWWHMITAPQSYDPFLLDSRALFLGINEQSMVCVRFAPATLHQNAVIKINELR